MYKHKHKHKAQKLTACKQKQIINTHCMQTCVNQKTPNMDESLKIYKYFGCQRHAWSLKKYDYFLFLIIIGKLNIFIVLGGPQPSYVDGLRPAALK